MFVCPGRVRGPDEWLEDGESCNAVHVASLASFQYPLTLQQVDFQLERCSPT